MTAGRKKEDMNTIGARRVGSHLRWLEAWGKKMNVLFSPSGDKHPLD